MDKNIEGQDTCPVVKPNGIDELEREELLTVYPNPFNKSIVLGFKSNDQLEIKLFDVLGREVYTDKVEPLGKETTKELDVSDLPQGVYLLVLNSAQQKITKKLIKAQ